MTEASLVANLTELPRRREGVRAALVRRTWVLPAIILGAILFVTIFAPLISPHDPGEVALGNRFLPPAWQAGGKAGYLLGTDALGRDMLSRIFYGGRVSLAVAVVVLAVGGLIGLALGVVAGYVRGIVGTVIMRLADGLMAIPPILIALDFAMTLKPGMVTVIVALIVVIWARFARVMRGEVLALADRTFVLQARVAGSSHLRIMFVHLLPNVINTFVILLSLNVGWVVLTESSLSFLGAGIPPSTPSWGQMVSEGRQYIASAWWISLFPGTALGLTVLSVNMLGDWLRDRFDPKLRQL